jgi:hypothetical protein
MYLQKVISRKTFENNSFLLASRRSMTQTAGSGDTDPLVRGTDRQIRTRSKMLQIRNTGGLPNFSETKKE